MNLDLLHDSDLAEVGMMNNVALDLRYATDNNFTKTRIYSSARAFLHKDAAIAFNCALKLASNMNYKIKIFDAFRPYEAQKKLWDIVHDPRYVSDPDGPVAAHCRGVALDVTLIDAKSGQELDMGTEFDDFTEKSHHGSKLISKNAENNRGILLHVMESCGFEKWNTEWWHYQLPNIERYKKLHESDVRTGLM